MLVKSRPKWGQGIYVYEKFSFTLCRHFIESREPWFIYLDSKYVATNQVPVLCLFLSWKSIQHNQGSRYPAQARLAPDKEVLDQALFSLYNIGVSTEKNPQEQSLHLFKLKPFTFYEYRFWIILHIASHRFLTRKF